MRCKDILSKLENIMPLSLAMDWDNVGLLIGSENKEVKKILICLDVNTEALKIAIKENIDLIISHHPLIFSGLKSITDINFNTENILELIKKDISYIAMHTNYDIAKECMGDKSAQILGLIDTEVLEETYNDKKEVLGVGKVGIYNTEISIDDLAALVKERFNIKNVAVYAKDRAKKVKKIAISPGSGKNMYKEAIKKNADILITGDITHHEGLDAKEAGIAIIDAGHYGIEKIFIKDMKEKLENISDDFEIVEYYEDPFYII